MSDETGFHDSHGIPIYCGDLIRVEHYIHRRGRRKMWLYFRVAMRGTTPVVENWHEKGDAYQCWLADCGIGTAEVLTETDNHHNTRGELMTFNERPRNKS